MDGADADLVKSSEEILGNVHGLLEVLHPDVDVGTHVEGLSGVEFLFVCWDESKFVVCCFSSDQHSSV